MGCWVLELELILASKEFYRKADSLKSCFREAS